MRYKTLESSPLSTKKNLDDRGVLSSPIYTFKEHNSTLYVGCSNSANNLEHLKSANIGLIVNCAKEVDNFFHDVSSLDSSSFAPKYINLRISDSCCVNILDHLSILLPLIHKYLTCHKQSVLVHCVAGVSRSATVAIAYLMKYRRMSLSKAFEWCNKSRPIVRPNLGFFQQLQSYDLKLTKSLSYPLEDYITKYYVGCAARDKQTVLNLIEAANNDMELLSNMLFMACVSKQISVLDDI